MTRVALYARVSTNLQRPRERAGQTPLEYAVTLAAWQAKRQDTENQLIQLREFCERQGWPIAGEYVDNVTGKSSDRAEFQRLFTDASQRKFDMVLFWSLDRFSREGVRETLNHLERLTAAGVGYRSYTEQYLDSCGMFKDAVLAILAVVAKQERIRLSERTVAGLARARRAGRVGGRPRVVVDRERVAAMAAAGGTTREIAAAVGVSAASVCRILGAGVAA